MNRFLLVLTLSLICGCADINYPEAKKQTLDLEEGTTYSVTSDLRLVHVLPGRDGKPWLITEPPPDAAFSYQDDQKIDLSLVSAGNEKSDEGDDSQAADMPLTGRAAYVVFAREMLFRLNEMSYNIGMSNADYQKNFQLTLETIKAVALLEAAKINQAHNVSVSTTEETDSKYTDSNTQSAPKSNDSTVTDDSTGSDGNN